ncbi:hypothetical protein EZV62_026449 [Acer yangbiense]|uniref:Gnk2-homologous domain-containing protein n=1 Tax=Acer yangbiense TaxID=1000413 RepID=A0A5C7GRG4_9ROSI|nr:hypothetical protein EZV62_026449 [Acer yangbiense]
MKMSSLEFFMIFVYLLSLSSSLLTYTSAADPNYIHHFCSGDNFTINPTFQSNLHLILSTLVSNANGSNGFSNATEGQGTDRVYSLFQCRSDLPTSTCQDCIGFASTDITRRCPTQNGAIIWYDECLVHFSDKVFFSRFYSLSIYPSFESKNEVNLIDPTRFQVVLLDLMNEATKMAVNNNKRFATRQGNYNTSHTIYTLVQCTRDLSSDDCGGRLRLNTQNLPTGVTGGKSLFPSCYSMFEVYPFYNDISTASPPPEPTQPTRKRGISSSIIVAIVAPITVSAVLFVVVYCFLTRRAREKYSSVLDKKGKFGN